MEQEKGKTIKDMSVEYIRKLADILEEIDYLKFKIMTSKKHILILHQRIHALYCHIYGKVGEDDVRKQNYFRQRILDIGDVFYTKNSRNHYGEIERILKWHPRKFNELQILLEDRELHLRKVIETAGLTVASINNRRRLS